MHRVVPQSETGKCTVSSPTFSDEPSRVAQIVKSFLGGQTGAIVGPESEPLARLVIGGDRKDDCVAYEIYRPVTIVVGTDYVRGPKFALYELGLLSKFRHWLLRSGSQRQRYRGDGSDASGRTYSRKVSE